MNFQNEIFGIDLGTTNSCIARYSTEGPKVIFIEGSPTIPSVVAFEGPDLLVGKRAKNHRRLYPEAGVASVKRQMGAPGYRVTLNGAEYDAVEISAMILRYIKKGAEEDLGAKGVCSAVEDVVITVPAWFGEDQRQATLSAGKKAGLNVLRIVNEPTSAALTYDGDAIDKGVKTGVNGTGNEITGSEKWLVYDLGGGTFDVSVLQVVGHVKEVLASCGNVFLGGDDFDLLIARHFAVI